LKKMKNPHAEFQARRGMRKIQGGYPAGWEKRSMLQKKEKPSGTEEKNPNTKSVEKNERVDKGEKEKMELLENGRNTPIRNRENAEIGGKRTHTWLPGQKGRFIYLKIARKED